MSDLTHVELLWLEKRIENWIRFGHAAEEQILDRRRRILSFAPGSIFAFVRWTSSDFGTVISRIDIVRAVAPGQRCATVPYVRPGGDVLLRLSGWPKVERVLQRIDVVEALGIDPADAAPDYGSTSTTVCPSMKRRDRTRARAIRPGCIGGGSRRERPRGNAFRDAGRHHARGVHYRREIHDALFMERLREPANWSLPIAAREQAYCHRTCRGRAAPAARNISQQARLSAARHSDAQARAGASWTNGLQRSAHRQR
jgi:hypothetical protein